MSKYLPVCRQDFTCFSCGREFKLPGEKIKLNKIRKNSKKRKIERRNKNSREFVNGSLIPSRNAIPAEKLNSSQNQHEIEIEHIGHESSDDEKIRVNKEGIEKSSVYNNKSKSETTKTETIDRFYEIILNKNDRIAQLCLVEVILILRA